QIEFIGLHFLFPKLVHQTRMARAAAKPVAAVLRRTVTPSLGSACAARGTTGPSATAVSITDGMLIFWGAQTYLAQKIDTGRTVPCSVHAVKVGVTHGLAAVPVLLAKWDLAVSKAVPLGTLVSGASTSATVEELPVTRPLGNASAHLERLGTSVTLDASQCSAAIEQREAFTLFQTLLSFQAAGLTSTAPTALCDASVPARPSATHTMGNVSVQPRGWGQPARKVTQAGD
ncbi:hypothetical protein CIB84_006027, partial [Bambusicola thoracicus]